MHFADNDVRLSDDPNLKYRDETDAYTTISTRGHFTPNPKMTSYNPSPRQPYNPPTLSSTEHVRPEDLSSDKSRGDVAVLDLISRTGGDLSQPRGISGSSARVPDVGSYTRDGIYYLQ